MDWSRTSMAGLKAAAMGSLIGTSVPSVVTIGIGATFILDEPGAGALLMVLPFMIGMAVAIAGLLLVGLPVTIWLKARRGETRERYLAGGLISGAVMAGAISVILFEGLSGAVTFFAAFGAFTGGVTAHFWWRYAREQEVDNGVDEISEVFG